MLGRLRPVLVRVVPTVCLVVGSVGCRSVPDPAPSRSPDPRPIIDAAGEPFVAEPAKDEPTATAEAEAEAESKTEAGAAEPGPPHDVGGEINERYAEQQNPRRWALQFEREGREVFDHRDQILDLLALREGMTVADVGAGTGLFTLALAERVGSRGRVHAVDVQAYFLDHIGQKARKAGLRNIELVRATQDSVGLPEASVDLVLMCDAYHHVERPAAYLASLLAAIRPGGRLFVVDYIAIEGKSEAWLLDHIRATPAEFRAEIEGAGFAFVRAHEGLLEQNFVYEFERP
ncbi:class I SAM-dependent methyltransferase [Paraliomyxa miuraensis]|uniref:class I SAM-dependent methyltransferase n=1 Tax=Paraliomyxa miuraensis TaxID=376150 RepID=UPI00225A4225|nr:methyltransferase domain-containing protein [Paraliomyxa miuraensis]MCX4247824.1 methyltransferase domain-containing protein [Paraliomyxa miuraensis]